MNVKHIKIHVYKYSQWLFANNLCHRDWKPKYLSKFWTKHGGDGKRWPLTPFPFLAPWPSRPQPSRRHHDQSLLGPSFHDPRMHHVLESHPEQVAPLSRRDHERWHAIGSHSALALHLHLAACSPSSSCRFWVSDHLCSNLSQSFYLCWITDESRKSDLWTCVCVFTFSSSAFAFW